MKDYHKIKGKYIIPRTAYHRTLWMIRDYQRIKDEIETETGIKGISYECDKGSRTENGKSDSTSKKAIANYENEKVLQVIEEALKEIPKEYRKGIWNNIQYGTAYPTDATRVTYSRNKSKFIYLVAKAIELVR